jgi:hypothetical protein
MSTQDGSIINGVPNIPLTEDANFIRYVESKQKGEQFFVLELRGERMQEHYEYLKIIPAFKAYFDYAESVGFDLPETQIHHLANFSQGNLLFITLAPCPEFHDVFKRFAFVFEQTYTRFLDLKKAEAQAREARIEAALEKVRSRSLAMHKSDEIDDVLHVVYERLKELDIDFYTAIIILFTKGSKDIVWWLESKADRLHSRIVIPNTDIEYLGDLFKARENGIELFSACYSFEEKNKLFHHLFDCTDLKYTPEEQKKFLFGTDFITVSVAIADNTGIHLTSYSRKSFSEQDHEVLKRFAKVFEQAYTRFLDLQKVEAQAREANIEASLERVRAKTMAMHSSDDVGSAIVSLFTELDRLGIESMRCGIAIFNKNQTMDVWSVTNVDNGKTVTAVGNLDTNAHKLWQLLYEAWKSKLHFFHYYLSGKEKQDYLAVINSAPNYLSQPLLEMPDMDFQTYNFKEGGIWTFSMQPYTEQQTQVMNRFTSVFSQTFRRYQDLQKAEAQTREAQIETALERVRSRTMGMHKSDELREAVAVVFHQMQQLGFNLNLCNILLFDKTSLEADYWVSFNEQAVLPQNYHVPYSNHPFFQYQINAWKNAESFSAFELVGELKRSWDEILFTQTDIKKLPAALGEMMRGLDKIIVSSVATKHGLLQVIGVEPLSNEYASVLSRFAKVFEQTYTRFLDLQKAEAQTRQAQIETAMEKVRARALAMQKPEELIDVAQVLRKEMALLGVEELETSSIYIHDEVSGETECWYAIKNNEDANGKLVTDHMIMRLQDTWVGRQMLEFYHSDKNQISILMQGENRKEWIHYCSKHSTVLDGFYGENIPDRTYHLNKFNHGYIGAASPGEISAESWELLKRATSVFSLAYTRFSDLQQAEAQAKEAQIEAALEKVRSRSLAMHTTNELGEVVKVIVEKLQDLGVVLDANGVVLCTYFPDSKNVLHWIVSPDYSMTGSYLLPYFDHPIFNAAWHSKESGDEYFSEAFSVEEKNSFFEYAFEHSDYKYFPEDFKQWIFQNDKHILSFAWQKNSAILIPSHTGVVPNDAEKAILVRFARVFEQAYVRFMDLKKSEAQAREATIEAALERVRGKAMAMHNSNDLSVTASIIFTELRKLGINPIRCGVGLLNKQSRKGQLYSAASAADGDSLSLVGWVELSGHPVLQNIYDTWIKNEEYYPELSGEQLKSYYESLLSGLAVPVPDWQHGQKQYGSFLPFSVGCLYAWSETPYDESELKILKRFATIIDLTFRRYIELQKSEASAKDAVRRASLDRVRAEIASMRTVDDLERITPLIWNELTILGVPFIRCGVFIMDELQQQIHTFLSTPDGKAIGAFHLPYDTPGNIKLALINWRNKKSYVDHWNEDAFVEFADILMKQGTITSRDQYLNGIPHGGFYLHFLPFLQGMLYVGNNVQLEEDELKLIQAVADAFSTAYARYEDFNKLEAAKEQIEKTVVDLKQTQAQLIQS